MRSIALFCALIAPFGLTACDSEKEPIVEPSKSKGVGELKQASKNEMSKEQLQDARRQAGFKSNEEVMAEAAAKYKQEERAFVKGRLDEFRKLSKELRGRLAAVEKGAAKWAKAKDPDAAHAKWNEKYAKDNKKLMKSYRELTEKGSRGDEVATLLNNFITAWENLNGDLGGKITENEQFTPTMEALGKVLDELDAKLKEIEEDDTVEADVPDKD